jgi:hypothetical protein
VDIDLILVKAAVNGRNGDTSRNSGGLTRAV